jgi:hypothetical protein
MKVKARYWLVSALLAGVLTAQAAWAGKGQKPSPSPTPGTTQPAQPTPPPNGSYSTTLSGSFAVCLDPTSFQEESCSTSKAQAFPVTVVNNGTAVALNGTSCGSSVEVDSDFPVDISPPIVTTNETTTATVTDFNPNTDSGDESFTTYFGGSCNGSVIDTTGATQASTGTLHFVVSQKGTRLDSIVTALQDPNNSIGDFSLSGVARLQQ